MVNSNDSKSTTHKGWIVLQRLYSHECGEFIAPTFWKSRDSVDLVASNLDNVVAIMPIEWEE